MQTQDYKKGMQAHVLAGGELDHDFTGEVTRADPDNFLVFVREPVTGIEWGMPTCNVTPCSNEVTLSGFVKEEPVGSISSKRVFAGTSNDPNAVEIVECGCCSCYHRAAYHGDCRNDAERFADPGDAEARLGKPTVEVYED